MSGSIGDGFWPDDLKLSILREVGVGGATVTDIVRHHDLTRQHIYQWRRHMKDKGFWPETEGISFPALGAPGQSVTAVAKPDEDSPAEIGFANGRTLHCPSGMSEAGYPAIDPFGRPSRAIAAQCSAGQWMA